ncbi:hypothetical protein AWRIB429_2057 [Oenococcus oeni AWRIB429]|uniref:Uncharacterized protein n=2 Tax=root TaxID=1 RepID=V5UTC3_9CAUD|nr:hypothetical protein CF81_gp42 [Oenococcus phage phiS11]AHB80319.1 hypothetical protein [Oenococcus phage phiS11]EFD87397.1 hypothetical protein AWRIB429_2057 [Oenococcus oeni AWRIB429]
MILDSEIFGFLCKLKATANGTIAKVNAINFMSVLKNSH